MPALIWIRMIDIGSTDVSLLSCKKDDGKSIVYLSFLMESISLTMDVSFFH